MERSIFVREIVRSIVGVVRVGERKVEKETQSKSAGLMLTTAVVEVLPLLPVSVAVVVAADVATVVGAIAA